MSQDKKTKVVVSWSSGKDSCLTLIKLQADPRYQVVGLFTSYYQDYVPFQATPIELLREQTRRVELPLIEIKLPAIFPVNNLYKKLIVEGLNNSQLEFDAVAFGDMFCNGIEEYRRSYIEPEGWLCVFPLLNQQPSELAKEIINSGIKTRLCCVDTEQLDGKYLGRDYNEELLEELPKDIDPCGENGEFHTLVSDAPCFNKALSVEIIDKNCEGRFHHLVYK